MADGKTPQKAKKYTPNTRVVIKSTSIVDARKGAIKKHPMSRPASGSRVKTRKDWTIIKIDESQWDLSIEDDTVEKDWKGEGIYSIWMELGESGV